jgi:hypothetical protein
MVAGSEAWEVYASAVDGVQGGDVMITMYDMENGQKGKMHRLATCHLHCRIWHGHVYNYCTYMHTGKTCKTM